MAPLFMRGKRKEAQDGCCCDSCWEERREPGPMTVLEEPVKKPTEGLQEFELGTHLMGYSVYRVCSFSVALSDWHLVFVYLYAHRRTSGFHFSF